MLTDDERRSLLALARRSIVSAATGGERVVSPTDHRLDASGVFVTITSRGELRGCLGTLECRGDLAAAVVRCAADAATEDPRFSPVSASELQDITVEVSVLAPLEEIAEPRPDRVIIGTHGLVVEQGPNRGLLLPQVAVEWGWTPLQFLRQTCRKAGLPDDAWQRAARVFRFEAEVFGE